MKNLKIKQKLVIGMVLMVLIPAIFGIVGDTFNKNIILDHEQAISRMNEVRFIKEREIEHLNWANKLQALFFFGRPFDGELNYTQCELGQWYFPFLASDDFKNASPQFQELILNINEPHKNIHQSVVEVLEKYEKGKILEAKDLYENVTLKNLDELQELIIRIQANLDEQALKEIQSAKDTTEKAYNMHVLRIVLSIFMGIGITLILINSTIIPMSKFVERIKGISKEDGIYQTITDFDSQDELGQLVTVFNEMVERVNAQQFELKESNEELLAQGEELTAQNEEIRAQQEELEETLIKLSEHEETLIRLYNFSQLLNKTIDFDVLVETILKGLQEETDAQVGTLLMNNFETDKLEAKASFGIEHTKIPSIKLGEGLVGQAAKERRVSVVSYPEGQLNSQGLRGELSTASEIYLPLVVHNRLLGVIALGRLHNNVFTLEEQKLLTAIADQVAVALDNTLAHLQTRKALNKTQEIDQLKSEMINTVSHELRTPLASILGFSELLLKKAPNEAKAQKYLTTIYNEAERLRDLINDFLDLQKIETGRLDFSKSFVDLGELVKKSVHVYQGQSKHNLLLNIEKDLPLVFTDPDRVTQVLGNILSNAIKYSPNGGDIEVKAFRRIPTEVEIVVKDYGLGIPEEALKNLFQPFFRVDNSDRRQIGGTGLGLSICEKIISVLGGDIRVQSEHGEGSTFTLTLPLTTKKQISQKKLEKKCINPITGDFILVIEDDQAMGELLSVALNEVGYTSEVVDSGLEGLNIIREKSPLAIVLDLILNGPFDGWEVLRRLKGDEQTRHIPVIISSSVDQREQGKEMGAADYLIKPFPPEKLVESIRTVTSMSTGAVGMPQENSSTYTTGTIEYLLKNKGFTVKEIKNEGNLLVVNLEIEHR